MAVEGDYAYLADGPSGLQVILVDCEPPSLTEDRGVLKAGVSLEALPNPGRGELSIRLKLPVGQTVSLRIYDPAGGQVCPLSSRPSAAIARQAPSR